MRKKNVFSWNISSPDFKSFTVLFCCSNFTFKHTLRWLGRDFFFNQYEFIRYKCRCLTIIINILTFEFEVLVLSRRNQRKEKKT